MSGIEELLAMQNQLMNTVSRTLPNFKKLGQAKMTPAVTRQRLTTLKETFVRCQELDAKIHLHADDKLRSSHSYFIKDAYAQCEDAYNEAADYMAEMLDSCEATNTTTGDVSRSSDSLRSSSNLPRINLLTFDGSYEKWESFRDRFTSMIHNDANLSDVERMHYLYSCLKGDASSALSHLAITETNFVRAWEILVSRYKNRRRLITLHLQTLLNLPSLTVESKDLCRLRDHTNTAIQSLKNLKRPVQYWDDILVFLVAQKLDKSSRKAWELKLGDTVEYPKFSELDQFLESRIRALDAIMPVSQGEKQDSTKSCKNKSVATHSASLIKLICPLCKVNHLLYQCPTFLKQTPSQRFEFIKKCTRCINCFSTKHTARDCTNTRGCKQCNKRHHTLLHFDSQEKQSDNQVAPVTAIPQDNSEQEVASHVIARAIAPKLRILLATARVRVHSMDNRVITVRALIDQGSAATLISENLAQCLRLPRINSSVCVTGIGDTHSIVKHSAQIKITPAFDDEPAYSTNALILKSLTKYAPSRIQSTFGWKHIEGLELADNAPLSNAPIEVIIGADLFGSLLLSGVKKGSDREPIAQLTTLGWILSGPISPPLTNSPTSIQVHHGDISDNIDVSLRRFWEIEEISSKLPLSPEENKCQEHFLATHSRNPDGRYIVKLPFKESSNVRLGDSRTAAVSSLYRLERRLQNNPAIAEEYQDFLSEYETLGHMLEINASHVTKETKALFPHYYIPHLAVVRESSSTTRLRVVFNASSRTTNGMSLNDHLMVGPKLQTDLATVILRWRQYRYVYTADIAKMYRQILVDTEDTHYQRILWRSSPTKPIKEYRLLTVTYGTAAAPYLALRVLQQLTTDEGTQYPLAVPVLRHQLYVDDCIFGADDKILAMQTRDQLIAILGKGGFRLRKWASNSQELLSNIDPSDHGFACSKDLKIDEHLKVLGISWNPKRDEFQFQVSMTRFPEKTKRAILTTIAKFFDPLGWIAPVIVTAKVFLQQLWRLKCHWDDHLPTDYQEFWSAYHSSLQHLNTLRIPRWTAYGSDSLHQSLHGFADASTKAYAAVIYLRVTHVDGTTSISLLTAKTKVAPIKTMTVPRLELSAALLLARLLQSVRTALQLSNLECQCWTDSTITLAWLRRPPSSWKTFVANRVSTIQTLLPEITWRHVPTADNPADCASRGLSPGEIIKHNLWWSGPTWLRYPPSRWPTLCPSQIPDVYAERSDKTIVATLQVDDKWDLASRFSSWPKLLRVTAYVMRGVNRMRARKPPIAGSRAGGFHHAILTFEEILAAKLYWIKALQSELFSKELKTMNTSETVHKTSSLISLNPYLDADGIIRVGGRLRHSNLPGTIKNPIIMKSHLILTMIIRHHHMRTLHAGSHLTLASLRTEYWILRARTTVRAVLYKCIPCTRHKAITPVELMGSYNP